MDKHLYRCDKCGLELSLINARGDDCPRCAGHFQPVHPLAKHFWKGEREVCDFEGCDRIAKAMYWESEGVLRARCLEHEGNQHVAWNEEVLRREGERLVSAIENRLKAEVEMDKYNKM